MQTVIISNTLPEFARNLWEKILDNYADLGIYEKTLDHETRELVYLPIV